MQARRSPNFDARPSGGAVDLLLLHYTGMTSAEAALDRLCDATAKVSAHYLIDEAGAITGLVDEAERAWHAGISFWAGSRDINARSIGIELVNPGHEWGYRPFTETQYEALIGLALSILARHAIPPARVLGHSDVAPRRRNDPGELFDWERLSAMGIGRMPDSAPQTLGNSLALGASGTAVTRLQADLAALGYEIVVSGVFDADTVMVLTAFQRHFRRQQVDGVADAETQARLRNLLAS